MIKKNRIIIMVFFLSITFSINAYSDVINVPDDYTTIQEAVNAAQFDDVIMVDEGQWAGAIIDEKVTVKGAGDTTIITTGVPYKSGNSLTTAFRFDEGADGTEISHLKVANDVTTLYFFGIFSRYVDNAFIHHITIADSVQAITNYNGSGWEISHNTIYGTNPVNGGGIGILINAWDGSTDTDLFTDTTEANNNFIAYNETEGIDDELTYSGPGICLSSGHGANGWPGGTLTGNIVYKNKCAHTGTNGVGFEADDVRQMLDGDHPAITGNSVVFNNLKGSTFSLIWNDDPSDNNLSRNLGYDENRGEGSVGLTPAQIFE